MVKMRYLNAVLFVLVISLVFPASLLAQTDSTSIVSAFFGLDNDLPLAVNLICFGGNGMDGMPVNFNYAIDESTLEETDFEVIDSLGNILTPMCAILAPANDDGENRTVLLVGEFGDDGSNPPVEVRVIGDLFTLGEDPEQSACAEVKNLNGAFTRNIVPLSEGPTLFFAQMIGGSISECPPGTAQTLQVAWDGGVVPIADTLDEEDLFAFYTVFTDSAGTLIPHTPTTILDINDIDNFHQLCLDIPDSIVKVAFEANVVEDPNADPNPACEVEVRYCSEITSRDQMEAEMASQVSIFPLPDGDYFQLAIEGWQGALRIQVCDLSGAIMLDQSLHTSNLPATRFDISGFPAGLYLVKGDGEEGEYFGKLLLLR